jgi:hypothetical protein
MEYGGGGAAGRDAAEGCAPAGDGGASVADAGVEDEEVVGWCGVGGAWEGESEGEDRQEGG